MKPLCFVLALLLAAVMTERLAYAVELTDAPTMTQPFAPTDYVPVLRLGSTPKVIGKILATDLTTPTAGSGFDLVAELGQSGTVNFDFVPE